MGRDGGGAGGRPAPGGPTPGGGTLGGGGIGWVAPGGSHGDCSSGWAGTVEGVPDGGVPASPGGVGASSAEARPRLHKKALVPHKKIGEDSVNTCSFRRSAAIRNGTIVV